MNIINSSMIIWLASYPKSGNTWIRAFLHCYLNLKVDEKLNLNKISLSGFPDHKILKEMGINENNFIDISSNWIAMQDYINLKDNNIKILKTHNALCTINGSKFTNKDNSAGLIYIVRDPRDIVLSYSHHLNLSFDSTIKAMINSKTSELDDNKFKTTLIGSWSDHFNSWKEYNFSEKILVRYEDLIINTFEEFKKIITYLNKIYNIKVDINRINSALSKTKFSELKKLEDEGGFDERGFGKNFFRKGEVGEWKNKLSKVQINLIEKIFKNEMEALGYL